MTVAPDLIRQTAPARVEQPNLRIADRRAARLIIVLDLIIIIALNPEKRDEFYAVPALPQRLALPLWLAEASFFRFRKPFKSA
jgi:hypothetical protein